MTDLGSQFGSDSWSTLICKACHVPWAIQSGVSAQKLFKADFEHVSLVVCLLAMQQLSLQVGYSGTPQQMMALQSPGVQHQACQPAAAHLPSPCSACLQSLSIAQHCQLPLDDVRPTLHRWPCVLPAACRELPRECIHTP